MKLRHVAWACLLIWHTIADADTNLITVVHTNYQHWLSTALMSINLISANNEDWTWDDGTLDLKLLDNHVDFIRFPSGETCDYFHWKEPNGLPFTDSWDPDYDTNSAAAAWTWMNFDEYMERITAIGARPYIGINIDSYKRFGHTKWEAIQEALWIQNYAESNYPGTVKFYSIGNESMAGATPWSPSNYADTVKSFSNSLKSNGTGIKIIANWSSTYNANCGTVLDEAGQYIDWLDVHEYWNWGAASWEAWSNQVPLTYSGKSLKNIVSKFHTAFSDRDLNCKLIFGEWNIGQCLDQELSPSRYQHGLMVAEIFMEIMKSGVNGAAFWPTIWWETDKTDGGDKRSLLDSLTRKKTAAYQFLRFFVPVLGNDLVECTSDWKRTTVVSVRSQDRQTLYVYLLSKRDWTATAALKLNPVFNAQAAYFGTIKADNDNLEGSDVTWNFGSLTKNSSGDYQITLPPWSLTRITLYK